VTAGGARPHGHGRAVALMVGVTLLWSIAGVVTRHLDAARSFEVTFWRSGFNAIALGLAITALGGTATWRGLARASWPVWVSGLCWAVMFTAFMLYALSGPVTWIIGMPKARRTRGEQPVAKVGNLR